MYMSTSGGGGRRLGAGGVCSDQVGGAGSEKLMTLSVTFDSFKTRGSDEKRK